MYSIEGLERGIRHSKKNIKVLKKAIASERETIASYRIMIDDIERADKTMRAARTEEKRLNEAINGVQK